MSYKNIRRSGVLPEEGSDVLESVLELARINSVPNRSDSPLRYPTGQPELRSHGGRVQNLRAQPGFEDAKVRLEVAYH